VVYFFDQHGEETKEGTSKTESKSFTRQTREAIIVNREQSKIRAGKIEIDRQSHRKTTHGSEARRGHSSETR
jgi:hypothetical protein